MLQSECPPNSVGLGVENDETFLVVWILSADIFLWFAPVASMDIKSMIKYRISRQEFYSPRRGESHQLVPKPKLGWAKIAKLTCYLKKKNLPNRDSNSRPPTRLLRLATGARRFARFRYQRTVVTWVEVIWNRLSTYLPFASQISVQFFQSSTLQYLSLNQYTFLCEIST